jgi:hypothetical protein
MQSGKSNDPDRIRIVERHRPQGRAARTKSRAAAVATIAVFGAIAWLLPVEAPQKSADEHTPMTSIDTSRAMSPRRSVSEEPPRSVRTSDHRAEAQAEPASASGLLAAAEAELSGERDPVRAAKRARELLDDAIAAGETTGIAAFPPPGTSPIQLGLVVPRDFELPEGYVRHHQITDDGRRLDPILMFSPDREFVDADGQPVAIPEDGLVPEEMAPAGLPLRRLAMPANPYGPSRRIE